MTIAPDWSPELRERSRAALDKLAFVPMRDHVDLKNKDRRFGQIALDDWLSGWPMTVVDRDSGEITRYDDCDALLADRWALD